MTSNPTATATDILHPTLRCHDGRASSCTLDSRQLVVLELPPMIISVSAGEDPMEAIWRRRDEWKERLQVAVVPPLTKAKNCSTGEESKQTEVTQTHYVPSSFNPTTLPSESPQSSPIKSKVTLRKGKKIVPLKKLSSCTKRRRRSQRSTKSKTTSPETSSESEYNDEGSDWSDDDAEDTLVSYSESFRLAELPPPLNGFVSFDPATSGSFRVSPEDDDDGGDDSSVASQHTVRTNIHNILGLASLLLTNHDGNDMDCSDGSTAKATIEEIHASSQQLQHKLLQQASPQLTTRKSPVRRRRRRAAPVATRRNSVPVCVHTQAAAAVPRPTPQQQPLSFENCSVLLADDNAINRKLLINMLHRLGVAHVEAVCDGQQVLDRLDAANNNNEFDVILLDIDMPVLSGRACWRELQRRQVSSRVAFVTGHVEERTADAADGFLSKPFCMEDIQGLLTSLLELPPRTQRHRIEQEDDEE